MEYNLKSLRTVMNKNPKLGGLSFVEGQRDIPFEIKRIYCIYKTEENQHRGFHAHKKNWQLLFCPYGAVDIVLTDGRETDTITLDEPSKGLVLHPGLWREMIWKHDDSVLCVAASEYYDPDEYIRDYDEYLQYARDNEIPLDISGGGITDCSSDHEEDVKMICFPRLGDKSRKSFVIEGLRDIPFEIRRVFYIFGAGNVGLVRGKHANRNSEFVLFNVSGRSRVKTIDENRNETVYELNNPREAVYLPRMVWKEMYDFTEDSVLMVVTNEYYDPEEYIRNFEDFAKEMKRQEIMLY